MKDRKRCGVKTDLEPDLFIDKVIRRLDLANMNDCNHGLLRTGNCVRCVLSHYVTILKEEYDAICSIVEKDIVIKDSALNYLDKEWNSLQNKDDLDSVCQ